MTFTVNTFATFAGSFTFAEGKQLSIEQVQGVSGASTVPSATAHVISNDDGRVNKQWLTKHLCLPGWDKLYHSVAQPAAPNLWRPLSDRSGLTLLNSDSAPWSDWRLVFEWIKHLTDRIFPQYGLRLQGEVWYQGESIVISTHTTCCD